MDDNAIGKLELNTELSFREQLVPQLLKKIEDWDAEFYTASPNHIGLIDEDQ